MVISQHIVSGEPQKTSRRGLITSGRKDSDWSDRSLAGSPTTVMPGTSTADHTALRVEMSHKEAKDLIHTSGGKKLPIDLLLVCRTLQGKVHRMRGRLSTCDGFRYLPVR